MNRAAKIASTMTLSALLAATFIAPAAHAAPPAINAPITSAACQSALTAFGKVQSVALPSKALISSTRSACANDDPALPQAQFVTVKYGNRTIGGVFAVKDGRTLMLDDQPNVTFLLVNGHNAKTFKRSDKYSIKNKKATVTLSNGRSVPATVSAAIGDGGTSITVKTAAPIGDNNYDLENFTKFAPSPDSTVYVFSETGPVKTTMGPVYEGKFPSVNTRATGTVIREDGAVVGVAAEFGTGMSESEYKFWKDRAYFLTLAEVTN